MDTLEQAGVQMRGFAILMSIKTFVAALAATVALGALSAPANAGAILDTIKKNDTLRCGVNTGLPGFSAPDSTGRWSGMDADFCRAVAATILGDGEKVQFVPLSAQARFTALQSGEIDLLSRNSTNTLTRDASLGLHFVGTWFYDGQGFLITKAAGVDSATQLDGATVCVQSGTTTELNLTDYFRANGLSLQPVVFEGFEESYKAYFSGRCDAYTTDISGLAALRSVNAQNPEDHLILPEAISKEPLAPAVRRGDDEYFAIVKWVRNALIEAEEYGVSSENVDEQKASSENPVIRRMLGTSPGMGQTLGLDDEWAYRPIKQIGNYGEIFARNVGPGSPLKLERGLNAQWNKGGVLYADPIR